ncbi:polysaccharide pyruvyl transferase family protein [Roseovarius aestuarii]|uniref:Exopolysaccharide glucosyl ketal-pyruvate-transferase n=1 Tax=Roseovarius aestuarii TaxID=475083 RepID=A0A1X7BTN1_9RHOB|nr:polysaccharide pyruvyl transferase family protein [Roseovarius aestuarii]SMC12860.1 Exopolysaccharide glucosyl ketal-pyruvate-transferase [Roseovarius aestuarii]
MKLTYFQGNPPNFGDELNTSMWQHLLPADFFDRDSSVLFLGIGSIIQHSYPKTSKKLVVGAGYGGYTRKPDVHDGSWEFWFVRGPQTAHELGLDPALAIADAAILLRETPLPHPAPDIGVGFMPHYESIERGNWQEACALAGITFIDPTEPTEKVISQIRGAKLVITEAMHGAIVADALRTPWIGIRAMHHVHRFKWYDWARALNIDYAPRSVIPSNCREAWAYTTGRSGSGARAISVAGSTAAAPFNRAFQHLAARSLQKLATSDAQLSSDREIDLATDQAMSTINHMLRAYARGAVGLI